jgi:phospholipid transport system substrate-binding protein
MVALAAALNATPVSARGDSAAEVIEKLDATLLDVMRNASSLGFTGRAERLRPVLTQSYDLEAMGRTAVGRAWESATPEQQAKLIELFERFTVANYASRFKDYNGQKFEILGERSLPQGKVVSTRIVRLEKAPVKIDYVMRPRGDTFRVVDVFLDSAISEVATRRSEFTSIISRSGFGGLLDSLRAASERLEAEAAR